MFNEQPLLFIPSHPPAVHSRTSSNCSRSPHPLLNRQMKIGKYFLEKTIGKGSFAVVKLATHRDTHQKVAIKIIDKSRLDPNDHKKLEREIAAMKSLKHPHIIRLYEVMESKNLIYLVTEYAANGELLDLLLHEKRLSEAKAKEKFRQLVLAVEYIHSKNIVHRDLKAENLLLDEQGNIKVADFGFANIFRPNTKLQTFCGSPPYAAPELFQCLPYSPEKVDVWSLGVLLYVFVCGHLPFDSNNLPELRKRVLSGQIRLPFYISADCSSLISHMLTLDPEQRYSINDIKNHPWLMLNNNNLGTQSTIQSMPNCQLTNAILDHAEALGYNRTQILKSVNGNSYDSDAAIWHLLLEKFQKTCQINNAQTPTHDPTHVELSEDDFDNYSSSDEDDDDESEEEEEETCEQYVRTHGLRRHTVTRPEFLMPTTAISTRIPNIRCTHPSTSIEPSLLSTRLHHLQQQQQHHHPRPIVTSDDDDEPPIENPPLPLLPAYHQRNPHSNSYMGLTEHSQLTAVSDVHNQQYRNTHWLSPPVQNQFHLNRRASDSGAHLLLFQQQHAVTGSNTIDPVPLPHIRSSVSNRSSRGSITRGAPVTPPTLKIIPHELEENADEEEDAEILARYLNQGKRHTVCEPSLALGGKARRGTRESVKDRRPLSRRSSDTSSNLISTSAKAHLERLYHNAVQSKWSEDDAVTTSSLQELHQLQKQVQKYPSNNTDSPINRRASAVPSPTNSLTLHIIREENQHNPSLYSQNRSSSSSSSSEALPNIDDDEDEMECEVQHQPRKQQRPVLRPPPSHSFPRIPYHHRATAPYYCNTSPLLAQRLAIPTMNSSYTP